MIKSLKLRVELLKLIVEILKLIVELLTNNSTIKVHDPFFPRTTRAIYRQHVLRDKNRLADLYAVVIFVTSPTTLKM
jgi:hypothetical protein